VPCGRLCGLLSESGGNRPRLGRCDAPGVRVCGGILGASSFLWGRWGQTLLRSPEWGGDGARKTLLRFVCFQVTFNSHEEATREGDATCVCCREIAWAQPSSFLAMLPPKKGGRALIRIVRGDGLTHPLDLGPLLGSRMVCTRCELGVEVPLEVLRGRRDNCSFGIWIGGVPLAAVAEAKPALLIGDLGRDIEFEGNVVLHASFVLGTFRVRMGSNVRDRLAETTRAAAHASTCALSLQEIRLEVSRMRKQPSVGSGGARTAEDFARAALLVLLGELTHRAALGAQRLAVEHFTEAMRAPTGPWVDVDGILRVEGTGDGGVVAIEYAHEEGRRSAVWLIHSVPRVVTVPRGVTGATSEVVVARGDGEVESGLTMEPTAWSTTYTTEWGVMRRIGGWEV
jgi:hypothetical protein